MNEKTDTRTKILDTAQSLMLREGFHGVTVDRLIAEAGISKGSFFYHFASKDDLPAALLENFLASQVQAVHEVLSRAETQELTPKEKIMQVIDGVEAVFTHGACGQPGCVMAAFSYQLMDQYPALREVSQAALEGWQEAFGQLFAPLCQDADTARELALHFMALLQGANVVARIENSADAVHGAIKHFKLYLTLLNSQASGL